MTLKRQNKILKVLIGVSSMSLLFYTVTIIIHTSFYTVLQADDFSHALSVGVFNVNFYKYFVASLQYAKKMYMTWQGTYFSMFIQALLSPLNNFGLSQLRVVMVLNALLFSVVFFLLIWETSKEILLSDKYFRMFICACVIIPFLGFRTYTEIFFWFSGAASYSMPLICLFVSFICLLYANRKKKNIIFIILSVFCGLCAMGGSLAVVGIGCYVMLLWTLMKYVHIQKVSATNTICFCMFLVGALFNVIAPGNYVRHERIDEKIRFVKSLAQTGKTLYFEIEWLLKSTNIIIFILLIIICGIVFCEKLRVNLKIYTFFSALALLTPAVAIFPVILGYSGVNFPNRCVFVVDLALECAILNFSFIVGCWINKALEPSMHKMAAITTMLLLFSTLCTSNNRFSNMIVFQLSKKLADGTLTCYYENCVDVLGYLDTCEESDVIIKNFPNEIERFGNFWISEDPTHWVNVAIAQYYKKNSIRKESGN